MTKITLKITYLKVCSALPGINELTKHCLTQWISKTYTQATTGIMLWGVYFDVKRSEDTHQVFVLHTAPIIVLEMISCQYFTGLLGDLKIQINSSLVGWLVIEVEYLYSAYSKV